MGTMKLISSRFAWYVLFAISLGVSRVSLLLFNDPEGPNLLIVTVFATALFAVSLLAYIPRIRLMHALRFVLAIVTQVTIATLLYFVFR